MQDSYKTQASSRSYSAYKQNLNSAQKTAYDSSFKNSYTVNNKMNFEDAMSTRSQRMSSFGSSRPQRIHVNNYYFGGPIGYGSAFVGPWDLWFLMRASDLFWYHHWNDINPYRDYFTASEFADMEKRIKQLEAQKVARDPSYIDPGADYDLQFSNDYTQKNLNSVYYTDKYSEPTGNPVATVIVIILLIIVLVLIFRRVSRPRKPKTFNSRIY